MRKPKRPLKPFRCAIWNKQRNRWEGTPHPRGDKFFRLQRKIEEAGHVNCAPKKKLINVFRYPIFPKPLKKKKVNHKPTKRQQQMKIYKVLKVEWRKNPKNHYCQALCKTHNLLTPAEPYPHHMKGRVGELLNNPSFWLPVCQACHTFIHAHPTFSYKAGWLVRRGK